jgi:transposase
MDHVAIDLGGRESQICVRAADGEIVDERRVPTSGLRKYLEERAQSVVIVETCAEAFRVADDARALGHEVKVVPASLARSLGVGSRGVKNDVRDARNLSETSCRMSKLPSVHIPSIESRERKAICGMREGLVGARTQLINTVRGWIRGQGIGTTKRGASDTYPKRVREHYQSRERSSCRRMSSGS